MHTVETVLLVLMIGAVTGIIARYIRAIPLPLIQIMLGAALSWPQKGLHIDFDPGLFMLLFIPPLLFADGWRIPKREFFALYRPILRLAFGLVLFTVIGMGYLIHWMIPEIPLTVAFALAAVISPTDAVAVSAITRNLGMPAHTMHVLEGESLLNDASGLVALKFAIAATLTGLFSWTQVTQEFLWIALGGLAVQALLLPRLVARVGEARALAAGVAAAAALQAGLAVAGSRGAALAVLAVGSASGLILPAASALKANNAPAHEQGAMQGVLAAASGAASGIGPILYGGIYYVCGRPGARAALYAPAAPFAVGAALCGGALALALTLPPGAGRGVAGCDSWGQQGGNEDGGERGALVGEH
jgi:NhaP-type Na+/H+ or K+/H+ antiporter